MSVEELIDMLRMLPATAIVRARIRQNQKFDWMGLEPLYEWRDAGIDAALYDLGEVYLQLDE